MGLLVVNIDSIDLLVECIEAIDGAVEQLWAGYGTCFPTVSFIFWWMAVAPNGTKRLFTRWLVFWLGNGDMGCGLTWFDSVWRRNYRFQWLSVRCVAAFTCLWHVASTLLNIVPFQTHYFIITSPSCQSVSNNDVQIPSTLVTTALCLERECTNPKACLNIYKIAMADRMYTLEVFVIYQCKDTDHSPVTECGSIQYNLA